MDTAVSAIVTTAHRVQPELVQRVARVCAMTGWPSVTRQDQPLRALVQMHELVYVVGREQDRLVASDGELHVHPGLLKTRLHTGLDHPLIRAIAPRGCATHVIDATLGLAGDALHLAAALRCRVTGIEVAPPLAMLLESGLARLARQPDPVGGAAQRIDLHVGHATQVLAQRPENSANAVLLAPMYATPDRAMPGFHLLRQVAHHAPPDRELVRQALRVAPRLVVKVPRGAPPPPYLQVGPTLEVVHGKRVDYWTLARDLGEPFHD